MTEQELKDQFAVQLRLHLWREGWTPQDLMDRLYSSHGLSVSRSTVWYWTNGRQIPRPIVIQWIAECFGESLRDFFPPPESKL